MNTTIILYVQLGFLFHLMGDYIFQTSWMANEKTKSYYPAFIHAFIYSTPFYFITPVSGWFLIFITHLFIDRYRLAVYWIKLINNGWNSKNHGYPDATPIWLSTWLLFIVDNTFHLIINTVTIIYFNLR